jgi:NAD(P)H-dependent FMN reductase
MTRIGVVLGSTRPGRNGEAIAKWVLDVAKQRDDAEFELVDLLDYNLPHLDEAAPPSLRQYSKPHTLEWANKIASFEGFFFVTRPPARSRTRSTSSMPSGTTRPSGS